MQSLEPGKKEAPAVTQAGDWLPGSNAEKELEVQAPSAQQGPAAKKANNNLDYINRNIAEVSDCPPLISTHSTTSGYCIQVWVLQCKRCIDKLEMVWGWSTCPLRRNGESRADSSCSRDDFRWNQHHPSVTTGKSLRMWSQALYMVYSRRTINNGHQLQEYKFGVDIKKKNLSPHGQSGSGTGFLDVLCCLYPWWF